MPQAALEPGAPVAVDGIRADTPRDGGLRRLGIGLGVVIALRQIAIRQENFGGVAEW